MSDSTKKTEQPAEVQNLQQEIEALKQQNEMLADRLKSLEGAVIAQFDQKICDLDADARNNIFQNYQSVLVNNFTDSVIRKLFDSGDFVGQMLQVTWQKLRTWRGIISLLGISGLGAVGILTLVNQMNNYVLSKADEVFEKQIDAKAPAMLERLERDRETIMLLTLDISAQDQVNLPNFGGIDPVREAYLDENENYEKILIDFLKGDVNSPLQRKIIRADERNKSVLRYYALNYILQVNKNDIDNSLKEALLAVLKDENIDLSFAESGLESTSRSVNRLDVRNQVLAIRALRRYKNQMNNLAKEVLVDSDVDHLYDNSTFWRGFLNELIFMPLEGELNIVQYLVKNSSLQSHQGDVASAMLMLFTLYPELCQDDCEQQLESLIEPAKASIFPVQGEDGPSKTSGSFGESPPDSIEGSTSSPEDTFGCQEYLTTDNLESLLAHRRANINLQELEGLVLGYPKLFGTFSCVLGLYHQDWQNFLFFQESELFYDGQNTGSDSGISNLLEEYTDLYWHVLEKGYLSFQNDYRNPILDTPDNFFIRVGNASRNQDENSFYQKLITDSQTAYQAWLSENFYPRLRNSQVLEPVFSRWLSSQGYDLVSIQDDSLIYANEFERFVKNIAWNENRYVLSFDHEFIGDLLAQGNGINLYFIVMETGYYPEEIWRDQIFTLFETYWNDVVNYDLSSSNGYLSHEGESQPPVSGTHGEQDALWQWIKHTYESDKLIFSDDTKKWELQES